MPLKKIVSMTLLLKSSAALYICIVPEDLEGYVCVCVCVCVYIYIIFFLKAELLSMGQIRSLYAPIATLGPGSKACSQEEQYLCRHLPEEGIDVTRAMSCRAASFMQLFNMA